MAGNEAVVERLVVEPLLALLGYGDDDISPKHKVVFQEGKAGRPNEADFAVFAGLGRSKDDALLVVEAKAPNEKLGAGRGQAESYAANLHSPFMLITNGKELVVWQLQPAGSSSEVISGAIADLASLRPVLEASIGRAAAIKYKNALSRPSALSIGRDVSPYLNSERHRLKSHTGIERRLTARVQNSAESSEPKDHYKSIDLLVKFPRGFVVMAPSGYGKTTLARSLMLAALDADASSAPIPVEVWLPDVVNPKASILQYAAERVRARCPAVSDAVFVEIINSVGAWLLADGLDRLSPDGLATLSSQVRLLQRDHPDVAIAFFTRANRLPDVELPVLDLCALNDLEQKAFILSRTVDEELAVRFRWLVPRSFESLIRVPVILDLLTQEFRRTSKVPIQLVELFDHWLENLLAPATVNKPLRDFRLREALSTIAWVSRNQSAPMAEVLLALKQEEIDEADFHELTALGALVVSAHSVELVHEALADHLRARRILNSELLPVDELGRMPVMSNGWLPVLLVAQASEAATRAAIWNAIASSGLDVIADAIRFGTKAIANGVATDVSQASQVALGDLAWGVEAVVSKFEPLRQHVLSILTGEFECVSKRISVTGRLDEDFATLTWSFTSTEVNQICVALPELDSASPKFRKVRMSKLPLQGGRLLGVKETYSALKEIVEGRHLLGGETFAEERLLSRLDFLGRRVAGLGGPHSYDLSAVEPLLEKQEQQFFSAKFNFGFSGREVLGDLRTLRNAGVETLNAWWLGRWNPLKQKAVSNDALAYLLAEKLRRIQRVYREICEHSLPDHLSRLAMYRAAPMRWQVRVDSQGGTASWWTPVEFEHQAGIDVEHVETFAQIDSSERLASMLLRLGRYTGGRLLAAERTWNTWIDLAPSGRAFEEESAVLVAACGWIERDLQNLFASVPT